MSTTPTAETKVDRIWAVKGTQPSDLQFTLNQFERDGFVIFSANFIASIPDDKRYRNPHFVVVAFKTTAQTQSEKCACYSRQCEHRNAAQDQT